jgi:hypothetical protein
MHMAGGGMHRGGRGDARASCASPLGTPLVPSLLIHFHIKQKQKIYVHATSNINFSL